MTATDRASWFCWKRKKCAVRSPFAGPLHWYGQLRMTMPKEAAVQKTNRDLQKQKKKNREKNGIRDKRETARCRVWFSLSLSRFSVALSGPSIHTDTCSCLKASPVITQAAVSLTVMVHHLVVLCFPPWTFTRHCACTCTSS